MESLVDTRVSDPDHYEDKKFFSEYARLSLADKQAVQKLLNELGKDK